MNNMFTSLENLSLDEQLYTLSNLSNGSQIKNYNLNRGKYLKNHNILFICINMFA